MVLVGIILLGAMAFGGVHLWRQRRKEAEEYSLSEKNQDVETDNSKK